MASSSDAAERKKIYSVCCMCSVRCPIEVHVENGRVVWVQGNPNDKTMGTSLCAKGSAGIAFEYDSERPQYPLIRTGERGAGQWRRATWDEALDYIADKLQKIIDEHGGRAVTLSDRGGPFNELHKVFLKAIGSPNYFNHHCTCDRNTFHAAKSVYGWGRKGTGFDYKKTKHIVLFGRNIFESIRVKEVKEVMDALSRGAKLTYIDPRATLTAAKATRFMMIRPNTEYALSLALINVLIKGGLYDVDFVRRHTIGFDELAQFIQPYTPEWAAAETGIDAQEIKDLAHELAEAKPAVIVHAGWMTARHMNSFYAVRAQCILQVLLGSVEAEGGLPVAKDPKAAGKKGLNDLSAGIPKVEEKRADGVGWMEGRKHYDVGPGLLHLLYPAIETGEPYPIKAYIAWRHNPLVALPDQAEQKRILNKLDLIVSVDVNFSETAWFADVILPEATYFERADLVATSKGPKPGFLVRGQCIDPYYDSKPGWWIITELAKRLGKGEFFPYQDITDIWARQLEGTGFTAEDILAKGFVTLVKDPIKYDRLGDLPFKTPSGKIELVSSLLEDNGFVSLKPYESPEAPPPGGFRLIFGRSAVHTHGTTQNNPYLNEVMPTNTIWINSARAAELGIADGDPVEVSANGETERARATVTDFIHPEAAFALHGFGHDVPAHSRSFGQGLADYKLQKGLLDHYDPVGGAIALTDCFVTVKKASA
jgi:thiosulfate reductase/polysulfide reductase chain A